MFSFEPSRRAGTTILPLKQNAMPSNTLDKRLKAVFIHQTEKTLNSVQFINVVTLMSSDRIPWTCGSG